MGVHQRIDRLAKRELKKMLTHPNSFPAIRDILHFEGLNGPDGIKRKSPGQDEPWHYVDPTDPNDNGLRVIISDHMHNLTVALVENNPERAAFEAAWLSHAITDGLTPAHHYPLEEKLEELRDGQGLESRNTARKKLVLPGKTRRNQFANNWEFWGARGVMTTHIMFEWGIATTLAAGRMANTEPSGNDMVRMKKEGFIPLFDESLHRITQLELYEEFSRAGWTRRLARETKAHLMPEIVRTVTLAWYSCAMAAEAKKAKS
jgi:hypothetical protein